MRHLAVLLLLIVTAPMAIAATERKVYSVGPAPSWAVQVPLKDRQSPPMDQVSQGLYYLLVDLQTRVDADTHSHYRHLAKKALNERGVESISQIEIETDPSYQTLTLHAINLYRGGKAQSRLANSTIHVLRRERDSEHQIYDGRVAVNVVLNDVRVGDIVEYTYSVEGANPVFGNRQYGQFDLQWAVPMQTTFHRLLAPSGRAIALHKRNTKLEPTVTEANGYRDYRWQQSDLPALTVSQDSPAWFDPYPVVYWDEFPDWAAVANWAVPLYRVPEVLSAPLRGEVERIKASGSGARERLMAALRFVQGEIRYLGVEIGAGSHAPTSPNVVMERRFGDCKDKTLLTVALLQSLGIDAQPALVNSNFRQGIKTLPPTPGAFNHVIVRARLDGRTYWLDPTRARQDADLAHIVQADFSYALVVDPATTELVSMKSAEDSASRKSVNSILDVPKAADKPANFTVTTVLVGAEAESTRATLSTATREELQKKYLNYYASYYPKIAVAAEMKVADEPLINRLTITERYVIADFWERTEKSERREGTVFIPEVGTYLQKPAVASRTSPLAISHPVNFTQTTEINLTGKWDLKPEHIVVDDTAFHYERDVTFKPAKLTISDRYQSHADNVALTDIAAYSANVNRARAGLDYSLNWNGEAEKPAADTVETGSFNWVIAFIGLLVTVIWVVCALKVHRYDPPARTEAIDPSLAGIGGWLILPMLSICLRPLRLLKEFAEMLPSYSSESWASLTVPGGTAYHAAWAPLLLFELTANLAMIVFSVLLVVMFFEKRRLVPLLFLVVTGGSVLINYADLMLLKLIPSAADTASTRDWAELVGAAIGFMLWGSYFLMSKRVKATFVRTRKKSGASLPAEPTVPAEPAATTEQAAPAQPAEQAPPDITRTPS